MRGCTELIERCHHAECRYKKSIMWIQPADYLLHCWYKHPKLRPKTRQTSLHLAAVRYNPFQSIKYTMLPHPSLVHLRHSKINCPSICATSSRTGRQNQVCQSWGSSDWSSWTLGCVLGCWYWGVLPRRKETTRLALEWQRSRGLCSYSQAVRHSPLGMNPTVIVLLEPVM